MQDGEKAIAHLCYCYVEGAGLVLDRYFGPHAVLSLDYNPVPSQSDKLRDLGEGLGRNVQMLSGPFLTPPAPVRPLAVSPSTVVRSKTSLLLNFNNHVFGPYLRPPEKQLGNK